MLTMFLKGANMLNTFTNVTVQSLKKNAHTVANQMVGFY